MVKGAYPQREALAGASACAFEMVQWKGASQWLGIERQMKGVGVLAQETVRWSQRFRGWLQLTCRALGASWTSHAPDPTPEAAPVLPKYAELAQGADFPVLSAADLITLLELQPRVDAIRQLLGLPAEDWRLLGQGAIDRIAEAVQLCPASEVHHHAFAGGLLVHTLEVAEHALRLRKRYQLPIRAGAETINEAGPRWTYAVFAAALLHDPGKLVAGIQVITVGQDRTRWTPLDHPLVIGTRYRVQFAAVPYRLHAQASLALFSTLLPPEARRWLGDDAGLLEQLLATTYDAGSAQGGAIAEILKQADGASVRADLGQSVAGPLVSAQSMPLVDRLMGAIRRLIADGELKVNAPGAQIWVSSRRPGGPGAEREAWVLCKSLADAVIARLRKEGDSAVPANNERIFDTLQEHGMVRATREGQAVWQVRVGLPDWTSEFRVLRFPAWRLWPPGRVPEAKAKVRVFKPADSDQGRKPQAVVEQPRQAPKFGAPPVEQPASGTSDEDEAELLRELMGTPDQNRGKSAAKPRKPAAAPVVTGEVTTPSDSPFLDWLRTGLNDGSIETNSESAFVHGADNALLLISPRAFREFATQCGGDWTTAQTQLAECGQLRRKGRRTVLPFAVAKSGAQVNCVVIETPQKLNLPPVPCNPLLQQTE